MPFNLTDTRKKVIIESLEASLEDAKQAKAEAEAELKKINDDITEIIGVLKELGETKTFTFSEKEETNGYPSDGSWSKKALYVLSKRGRGMTTREIAEDISAHYETKYKASDLVPKLSVSLTTTQAFVKKTRSNGENEYIIA
jgi:hypothetical protein